MRLVCTAKAEPLTTSPAILSLEDILLAASVSILLFFIGLAIAVTVYTIWKEYIDARKSRAMWQDYKQNGRAVQEK